MEDERYDEKWYIMSDVVIEYHDSKRLYEEAEKKTLKQ